MENGNYRSMASLLDAAVFPGTQGGPLEHVIAAKAVSFGEALKPEYKNYMSNVKANAALMANCFVEKGYKIISGGTDNHSMLIDLRTKEITGKDAEDALVKADITVNKNMVPFDTESPFVTSGIRIGTSAITTRGINQNDIPIIVEFINKVIENPTNQEVINQVKNDTHELMNTLPLFTWK